MGKLLEKLLKSENTVVPTPGETIDVKDRIAELYAEMAASQSPARRAEIRQELEDLE